MQFYILDEEINKKINKQNIILDHDKTKEKDKTGNKYEKFQGRGDCKMVRNKI